MASRSASLPEAVSHTPSSQPPMDSTRCPMCEIAQRYRSLIEASPSVIVCLSPDYRILEFNRTAERLYGQPRSAILGHNYLELFLPAAEQKAVAEDIQRVLAGHATHGFENLVRTPGGVERVLQWSVSRILNADGAAHGIIAIGRDVTERKQAEERSRRYEHIVRTSGDFIAFVDSDYVCWAVNATYLEAFDKTEGDITGLPFTTLLGDQVFETRFKPYLDRCMVGQHVRYELWLDCPRWGRRCLDVHMNPVREADGRISGVAVVGRDITARQQADQVLVRQQQQLRTLASELALAGQRERRRVALGLHDQVGQALVMAKLKLRTALGAELTPDVRNALEEGQALLNQSIQATRSLTFQLSSAVLQELGLVAALQQLVEWFDAEREDTHFVFQSNGPEQCLSEDTSLMLYDMASELLFNAAKYAHARDVSITVESAINRLQITIEDNGVGFDTTRLNDGPSPEGGFGYFSIRERLAALGGKLAVESSVGQGTRVSITTPLDRASNTAIGD